jgi:hypothetical protein
MPQFTPSGPFTFASTIQFPSDVLPIVPDTIWFNPKLGNATPGDGKLTPQTTPNKVSTPFLFTTILPLVFLYTTVGELVFAPICAQLVLYLVTDVVGISARISENLVLRNEQEETKAKAIPALAVARNEIEVLKSENFATWQRHKAVTKTSAMEKASLLMKLETKDCEIGDLRRDLANARTEKVRDGDTLRTVLAEKCKASDAHDKEVAALKETMETDRGQATLIQKRLQHTIAEQTRSERVRLEQLDTMKKELAQAQNELLSRRSPQPPPSYQAEVRSAQPKSASRPSYRLPGDLMTLAPLSSGFTCIGTTQKGLRCRQAMISNHAKASATERLEVMRSTIPGNAFEMSQLQELASWMLCPRWHSGNAQCPQHSEVASKWFRELKGAREEMAAREISDKAVEKAFSTPTRPSLFGSTLSTNSSHSSLSSTSSIFSAASFESSSSVGTSPECSPLARKSTGTGRRAMEN